MEFEYTIETDEGEIIPLEVTYKTYGEHLPATRHEPEEFPELEIGTIVNAETGQRAELSDAEYQEVQIKAEENWAEENYSQWAEAEDADRGCSLYHQIKDSLMMEG